MVKCISNKRAYPTKEVAEDALIEAHTQFDYGKASGPVAVYQCEDCGYYHLTSKGPMNEKLEAVMKGGKLKHQKEASLWMHKLKKR